MSNEHVSPEHNRREAGRAATTAEQAAATTFDITLLFDGLFYVCWNPKTSGDRKATEDDKAARNDESSSEFTEVQIGVLSTVPEHELSIKLSGQIACGAARTNDMGTVAPDFVLTRTLVRAISKVEFECDPSTGGGTLLDGDIGDRMNSDMNPDSIRWMIDFDHDYMHGELVSIKPGILKPIIHIRAGELFTDAVTKARYIQHGLANVPKPQFGHVAERIGLRLRLAEGQRALLKVDDQLMYTFAKTPGEGIHLHPPFTVAFDNRRPQHKPPARHHKKPGEKHEQEESPVPSDLHFFYQALEVSADKWLDLQPDPESLRLLNAATKDDYSRGAPPAICFPSGGGKTTSIPGVDTSLEGGE
jgi:hypothetical protein